MLNHTGQRIQVAIHTKTRLLWRARVYCEIPNLEFSVGVRADFAVQVNFFVLRGNPFHVCRSLKNVMAITLRR